ncbi:phosphonate ABC transporter ATP-binding protein [Paenibacillus crassostreae]|uniref:Phosphonate ABC transporter ATP-binding protein n=1 Tax=Paenibacillus crassostreae TaxID=1763538 RepID=A0A167DTG5_9BACL|nr:ATP-binding cassette domain-containing protein [Paenibacillus crassostreae]AOZ91083.1 phosphonate ABC transporter ATP-binding protein [Paenibacillus crassostreae]OAB74757.1 phosphonate ABC transporter ATP-binding protein [Paenibacillus crassostreae]
MITIEHLTKFIGIQKDPILHDVNFQFHKGEMIAIVGSSGSGKSTLLQCLSLNQKWDQGSFNVDGVDVLKLGFMGKQKIKKEWAYLEQSPEFNPKRTALKNVIIGQRGQTPWWRRLSGTVRSDDYMGAMDVIESLGLLEKAHFKMGQLSGGERQRIAISRALVHGAKVILADEPVVGLDPKSAESVLEQLRTLCKEERVTVLTVIPLDLAERYGSRIIGLSKGEIVFDVKGRRLTQREKSLI